MATRKTHILPLTSQCRQRSRTERGDAQGDRDRGGAGTSNAGAARLTIRGGQPATSRSAAFAPTPTILLEQLLPRGSPMQWHGYIPARQLGWSRRQGPWCSWRTRRSAGLG
ncbi:hypothetical protein V496_06116 [Pseudogymnoascus sp. VKM F-4515 (FW-2607)]|nr:hypothetical protein V496_06116 [Pseudogymnoascus sp. VKM F-4515 (FW-2607)]KFY88489.1 hypothetical protein V498_06762 [Pseudogymnoascus sp. VKM F-4517 (FW-2822)]